MIVAANGWFHSHVRVERGSKGGCRIIRHGHRQRNACLTGQEGITGRSSLVTSCNEFREYLDVHERLRRAARMVDEEE